MSAHTPGPWTIEREDFNAGQRDGVIASIVDPRDGVFIAEVWGDFEAENESDVALGLALSGTSEANARLIAAAPELYAVLQQSQNWLASYPGDGALGLYDKVRALLARIDGQAVRS